MIEDGVTTGKAIRKDAVKVASFLVTSDHKFFEGMSESVEREFFATAYDYFCEEYGKENIAYAMVHKDEKTPHMHVGFVPITEDGRLSAKDFFGKKQQLVQLQDKFHQHMLDAGFTLERGVSSDRKHVETARFKAETFVKMEKEAQAKYEKTMSQLNEIEDRVDKIEKIEPKKVPMVGRVLKEEDYTVLIEYAKAGATYKVLAENLQEELNEAQNEVTQLKSELQTGQDKVRNHYKEIEVENKDLKTNMEILVNQKAEETIKIKDQTIKELEDTLGILTIHTQTYQNENQKLKVENKQKSEELQTLKEKFNALSTDFSAFKERLSQVLQFQFNRIKGWLQIADVERSQIRFLEQQKEKFVAETMQKMAQPIQEKQIKQDVLEK
jgi:hypothetical protein